MAHQIRDKRDTYINAILHVFLKGIEMADAYGTLLLSHSDDAVFSKVKMIKELNKLRWDNWGGKWAIDSSNIIFYDAITVQYPAVFPTQIKSVKLMIDGEEKVLHPSEVTEEHEDFILDEEEEIIPLYLLRDSIKEFIKKGWIEIACVANEKQRYVYMQKMRIYSDGRAIRTNSWVGTANVYPNLQEEEYLN